MDISTFPVFALPPKMPDDRVQVFRGLGRVIWGFYRDNGGKENGNYYNGVYRDSEYSQVLLSTP